MLPVVQREEAQRAVATASQPLAGVAPVNDCSGQENWAF